MQINIFSIQKNDKEFDELKHKYIKLLKPYAVVNDTYIYNKHITHAQNLGAKEAKKSYGEALNPYKKGFCIVLDENSKEVNSIEFANLLKDKNEISFFIGGAYGLSKDFIASFDLAISLSRLTLAHKFVKILLLEQIYRGFCINHAHPYHK
ncbi:23S rRNA (pseudouridine(1915)-N(3))-methyltransferase RlmH [Campylobacter sp. US33a]|uniref:Ribosomal RNA large subunit methyltransferase H n=1 Tax=Campylobacter sp. CCS1377 TaxID=3158229 RepID=A0AAU7E869_9BACT|nr:23S rRNA (pseudouridine(1915)-N(3))-methyltransferase RlmH [Campylobacter sp. US33a]MCW1359993.1 23S rRNA (pseudouridine(1915)-N(3))-methyltransferase RlmH [Campylobacter jejuni]TEY03141.1 23S rRNA (pseudouridine(1915)-N(3))-methyltransferase RlmH [Campylobacter sp. US33a]